MIFIIKEKMKVKTILIIGSSILIASYKIEASYSLQDGYPRHGGVVQNQVIDFETVNLFDSGSQSLYPGSGE